MFYSALLIIEVIIALMIIGLVLMQQGKGADAGAAFGSGASGTVFGASGAGNFLTRATAILAFLFMLNSLVLAYYISHRNAPETDVVESVLDRVETDANSAPADVPADAAAPSTPSGASDIPADVPSSSVEGLEKEAKEMLDSAKDATTEEVISVGEAIKGKTDSVIEQAKDVAKDVAEETAEKVVPADVPQ